MDDTYNQNKKDIIQDNKMKIQEFINKHESSKNELTEKDQFFMIMQLIKCAHDRDLQANLNPNNEKVIKFKWLLIKKQITTLWNSTPCNKYQVAIAKLTSMNLWKQQANK
jgi:hypothetical protein